MRRHAEIAGGGFGGLALGALLAGDGWGVNIHERSAEVREIGAGIFIHHNGFLVLDELGLMPRLEPYGTRLTHDRKRDHRGRIVQNRRLIGTALVWSFPRQRLIEALHEHAVDCGAKVITSSEVSAASPMPSLTVDGETQFADLVVGADGYQSTVRASLGLTRLERKLATTSIRYLLDDRELSPEDVTTENWSKHRRIAVAACGPDHTYVYLACPAGDERGSQVPLDVTSWTESFPHLARVFERLHDEGAYRSHYSLVETSSWSAGSAALLGDAAHALAPTLGQGSNLTLSNARSLASFLRAADNIPEALAAWERATRPVVENTQLWSSRYDRLTKRWPDSLVAVRAAVIWAFGALPFLDRRLRVAERTPPIAAMALT